MKIWKALAATATLAVMCAASARAEVYNQFCQAPSSYNSDEFIIVFKGDITAQISTSSTAGDEVVDPFTYYKNHVNNSATSTVTASYDSTKNSTTVTYASTVGLPSTYSFPYGNHQPHFGLDGSVGAGVTGGGAAFNVISQTWGLKSDNTKTTTAPSLSVDVKNPPVSGSVKYIAFYANVTSGGQTTGQWFEVPYTSGTNPKLVLTNYTGAQETLSNVGFFTSPTLIPLDNLNFADYPPPGSPGSHFTPLPQYDGSMLTGGDGSGGAGGTVTTLGLPEPSSVISMATGLVLVGGYLGRRFRSRRRGEGVVV